MTNALYVGVQRTQGGSEGEKKQHDLNTIENASMHIYIFMYAGVPGVIGRRLAPNPEIDLSLNCFAPK